MTDTVVGSQVQKRPRTFQDAYALSEMHDWGLGGVLTWEQLEGLPPLSSAPVTPDLKEKSVKLLSPYEHVPGQVDMGALPPHRGGEKRD